MRNVIRGIAALALAACSSSTTTTENPTPGGTSSSGGTPTLEPGSEIGKGDGTAGSVTFTEIYVLTKTAAQGDPEPVDLAFNPADPGELWIVGYGDDSTHVGYVDGDVAWKRYRDPAASHFMGSPVAIAMGADGFWGTCGNSDNGQNQGGDGTGTDGTGNLFMGPAMFSTDRAVFATQNAATRLGSHYDMLHQTPFCRGIAHEKDAIYWAFNAFDNTIDKYNFNKPHEKGGDDHSDGEIYQYVEGQVKGAEDKVTPSHLVFDPSDSYLYIADTGHQRIVKMDTTKGTKSGELARKNEPLKASGIMSGVDLEEVVAPGVLEKPSGIELKNDLLYVTDAATSTFHVFKKDGTEVRKLTTDLPAGSLAGFTFGSDGKIWFTDKVGGRVLRIDPK